MLPSGSTASHASPGFCQGGRKVLIPRDSSRAHSASTSFTSNMSFTGDCRHASIRTLEERFVSLGACWAFSVQPVLPSVWPPMILLGRVRIDQLDDNEQSGGFSVGLTETGPDPEATASVRELSQLLEGALLELPEQYRTVVMMRDVEEMNTSETAAALDLTEENVKVRLHRGRLIVRNWLVERVGTSLKKAFRSWASVAIA